MMITSEDLKNINGIEFLSDEEINEDALIVETVRRGKPLTVPEMLASKFKFELLNINKRYAFHENDEEFKPLRKYFATALKYVLLNDDPEKDEKFVKLRDEIGHGLEAVYYNEIVIPKLMDEVYDLFFIDSDHPLLYAFKDGDNDYSFTNPEYGKYGYLHYNALIQDAIDPEKKDELINREEIEKILDEKEFGNKTWAREYMERIGIIYSKLSQDLIKKNEESLKEIEKMIDDL